MELAYLDTLKDAWPDRPAGADPEALVPAFRRRIADARQKEMWNGVSLIGPQRDDVRVALGGRDVATHASRGQQRTIIVALKLAEPDLLGVDAPAPIVLLDDVFSELDHGRAERRWTCCSTAARLSSRLPTRDCCPPAGASACRSGRWALVSCGAPHAWPRLGGSNEQSAEEAAVAVQRALPPAWARERRQLATAQLRLAWSDVEAAGLSEGRSAAGWSTVSNGGPGSKHPIRALPRSSPCEVRDWCGR